MFRTAVNACLHNKLAEELWQSNNMIVCNTKITTAEHKMTVITSLVGESSLIILFYGSDTNTGLPRLYFITSPFHETARQPPLNFMLPQNTTSMAFQHVFKSLSI